MNIFANTTHLSPELIALIAIAMTLVGGLGSAAWWASAVFSKVENIDTNLTELVQDVEGMKSKCTEHEKKLSIHDLEIENLKKAVTT